MTTSTYVWRHFHCIVLHCAATVWDNYRYIVSEIVIMRTGFAVIRRMRLLGTERCVYVLLSNVEYAKQILFLFHPPRHSPSPAQTRHGRLPGVPLRDTERMRCAANLCERSMRHLSHHLGLLEGGGRTDAVQWDFVVSGRWVDCVLQNIPLVNSSTHPLGSFYRLCEWSALCRQHDPELYV